MLGGEFKPPRINKSIIILFHFIENDQYFLGQTKLIAFEMYS
jgi:hypothetical protein